MYSLIDTLGRMNAYGLLVVSSLLVAWTVQRIAQWLNHRALGDAPPPQLDDLYEAGVYARSQAYQRARSRFSALAASWDLALLLAFWGFGGFGWLDVQVRSLDWLPVPTGLLYLGVLALGKACLDLPFALWATFVLEARFGFNRTRPATFVADLLKGLGLAVVLGIPILALLLGLFEYAGAGAWLYCWIAASLYSVALQYLVPAVVLPLFNTFTPLEEGEMREALTAYAEKVRFPLVGIFVIDGSRRSSKSNAFFTGFGRRKRIALFDTLVEKHPPPELVAVLAHEVGHYRLRHIPQRTVASILHSGVLLFLLSIFLTHRGLFDAFGVAEPSVYVGFVLFGLLYTPVELALALVMNAVSRRHELQADRYAVDSTGDAEAMASALKRLAADNLSNLTPHPLHVFLNYSHPPIRERLDAIAGR